MKAINITVRRHCIEHGPGIDMIREWQLNKNAISWPMFVSSDCFHGGYKFCCCS
jgi:hypothetical protein